MFVNTCNRESEMQRSARTFLGCLATASDKNITISTKYDKCLLFVRIFDSDRIVNIDFYVHSLSQRRILIQKINIVWDLTFLVKLNRR